MRNVLFLLAMVSSLALGKPNVDLNDIPEDFTDDLESSLIGGQVLDPEDVPAAVRIFAQGSSCSASIVGPQTLLTAGHCQDGRTGKKVYLSGETVWFNLNGKRYEASCTGSPLYPDVDHDLALCWIDQKIDGLKYINISKEGPKKNEKITLSGYGCTKSDGSGGNDGTYRAGDAKVWKLSDAEDEEYDFITVDKVALCYGDSGGPAFKHISDYRSQMHVQYGVNSKGNIRNVSYLVDLNTKASKDFFKWHIDTYDALICGINYECKNGVEPKPPGGDCTDERNKFRDAWSKAKSAWKEYRQCIKGNKFDSDADSLEAYLNSL